MDETEQLPTQCLLSETIMPSPEEALACDRAEGLDLLGLINTHRLGLYEAMKLINYIRTLVLKEKRSTDDVLARVVGNPDALLSVLREGGNENEDNDNEEGEEEEGGGGGLLQPVLMDDPLLFFLGNLLEAHGLALGDDGQEGEGEGGEEDINSSSGERKKVFLSSSSQTQDPQQENLALREELAELRARLRRLSELMVAVDADVKVSSKIKGQDNDTYYFNSYSHFGIHETMLKDATRTEAYRAALQAARPLLEGKTVLDVGCGTGVLSMFAAKEAGATSVVGVDCSEILVHAREIVKLNGLDEQVVLVKGKMEEVVLPAGVEKVDAIVSEWMGYCLLYESMLPSVLVARDKYLKPGGLLLPNKCTMIVQGVSGGRLEWWSDVYGFDMSPLRAAVVAEPSVEAVNPQTIMTDACTFKAFDLQTVQTEDLDFEAEFALRIQAMGTEKENGESGERGEKEKGKQADMSLRGLVVSFDTFFDGLPGGKSVTLSTRPEMTDTHWHQTLFWLNGCPQQQLEEGDVVQGKMRYVRNAVNHRDYDVEIAWEVKKAKGGVVLGKGKQNYTLGS